MGDVYSVYIAGVGPPAKKIEACSNFVPGTPLRRQRWFELSITWASGRTRLSGGEAHTTSNRARRPCDSDRASREKTIQALHPAAVPPRLLVQFVRHRHTAPRPDPLPSRAAKDPENE